MTRRLLLAVALPVVAAGLLMAPSAAAQDTTGIDADPAVRAFLHTVEPAVPEPGDTLVLAGTVENTGDEPLHDVQALLRYSRVPLTERADVHAVPTDRQVAWGQRNIDFFDPLADPLPPGQAADYRIEVPVDTMDFGAPGVYAVGVDIRVDGDAPGDRLTVDTSRTVVPWLAGAEPLPEVAVALLWPLAAQPSLLPTGTLTDDDLATQIAAGGALSTLVEAPGDAPVSWVVDPDLLATAETMTDGYEVVGADGSTSEGRGAVDAVAWGEAFAIATDGDQPLILPYANPDLQAVARVDAGAAADTARQAFARTREWLVERPSSGRAGLAWPAGGVADEATLSALASAGTRTVVLSADSVQPATGNPAARVAVGDDEIDAVLLDSGLGAAVEDAFTAADPSAAALRLRQSWLAETALVGLAAQDVDEVPAPLVAAAPYGWGPDPFVARALLDVWTTTPWISATPLATLVSSADPAAVTLRPGADAAGELSEAYLTAVDEYRDQAAHYEALVAEPDPLTDQFEIAALRALASIWRDDAEAGLAYTRLATEQVRSRLAQVSVIVPESVTLSSSKGGFPLTVSNGLDRTVVVRLELTAAIPDRITVEDVPPQPVEAGENASVDVTAEAATNGKVPVTVQLTASDGAPLGPAQRMIVNATDYGTIGWFVVGGAALLFVGAAVIRVLRRRHPVDDLELPVEPEPLRETAR
ncbi:MAG TPA: DUF6049 family protein [Jiangellaceae bacterium]|nr:DUF6049 family protein [Jiangellaceae bacterium]